MSNVRLQLKDLLGEVLLLDLIQLRSARGHHIIGWGYKRVPARNMSDQVLTDIMR